MYILRQTTSVFTLLLDLDLYTLLFYSASLDAISYKNLLKQKCNFLLKFI